MAVTVYKHSDASAPVLSGTVGALIALLDAVLVNGYGAKPAAGWTKPFSGTNLAVYRNSAAVGSGLYLNVDDNAQAATAGAREARLRGNEIATQANTGTAVTGVTGPFPTTGLLAAGIIVRKSKSADATARDWIMVADQRTFHLWTKPLGTMGWSGFSFGDFFSLKGATDPFRAIIIGRSAGDAIQADESVDNLSVLAALTTLVAGHYTPRSYEGDIVGATSTIGKHGDGVKGSTTRLEGNMLYPNPTDGNVLLSQLWVHEDTGLQGTVRGRLRGLWQWLHIASAPVNDQDTFSGAGTLAGKTFMILKPAMTADGIYVVETSDTWETN